MGRWRPPPEKSSPYITARGYESLQNELKQLWIRRRDVTQHLATAAAEGDRSENAEYIYRKKELAEIDRRIRYLQKRLPILNVVRSTPDDQTRIFFGAWVTIEDEEGNTDIYRIVGPDEFEPKKNTISIDSPMAKILLKKQVDDKVIISTSKKTTLYYITAVSYKPIKNDYQT